MANQFVSQTFAPDDTGGYDVNGSYFPLSTAAISNGIYGEDIFLSYKPSAISQFINGLYNPTITLSFKLSNGYYLSSTTIDIKTFAFPDYATQQEILSNRTDPTQVGGFNDDGTPYSYVRNVGDLEGSTTGSLGSVEFTGSATRSVTVSPTFFTNVNQLERGFLFEGNDSTLTRLTNVTLTVSGYQYTGLPIITGLYPDLTTLDNTTVTPFSQVTLSNPGNPRGYGDNIVVILEDASGTPTDRFGTLSLPSGVNGTLQRGETGDLTPSDGPGRYTVSGGGLANLETALRSLVFTPSRLGDGSTPQRMTFELKYESVQGYQGVTTTQEGLVISHAPCYCPGTLIATERGEVPIEQLAVGERVLTLYGGFKPIRWIGQRCYDGRFIAGRFLMLPVCIRAGALAEAVPRRDLWVSPGHAIYLDGALVPAYQLVNGVSVIQAEAVDRVTYIHVELDEHDILFAEGCAAESFLDEGQRAQFASAAEFKALYPGEGAPTNSCARRLDHGFELQAIRDRVAARAGVPATAAVPGTLRGYVDKTGPDTVEGWAVDEGRPDVPVCLDILVNGRRVARVLANLYRADVRDAAIGNGLCGFIATLPPGCDGNVEVRRSMDGAALVMSVAAQERKAA